MVAGVVVIYLSHLGAPMYAHERITLAAEANTIAQVKHYEFAGCYDSSHNYSGNVFFVPDDTLMLDEALCLGIRSLQSEVALLFIGAGIVGILYYGNLFRRRPPAALQIAAVPALAKLAPVASGSTLGKLLLFFLKAGSLTFGSGLAIVPFLEQGLVREYEGCLWRRDRNDPGRLRPARTDRHRRLADRSNRGGVAGGSVSLECEQSTAHGGDGCGWPHRIPTAAAEDGQIAHPQYAQSRKHPTESRMTRRRIMISAIIGSAVLGVAALVGIAGHYAILKDDDDDDEGRDAVARGSRFAKVSLQQGLIASEQEGQPISGKFEVDRGKFQLSVYTSKEGKFSEVLVDYSTGQIAKVEPITKDEELTAAQSQSAAIAKAKISLREAVEKALGEAAAGFRALGAVPSFKDGHAVASVLLLKGEEFKIVN
jgi:hypothetical protein